jgi:hypothetical protein
MKRNQLGFTATDLFAVVFILAVIGGWLANIVKLVFMLSGPVNALFIGRIVGVFAAPLGAVLGFF